MRDGAQVQSNGCLSGSSPALTTKTKTMKQILLSLILGSSLLSSCYHEPQSSSSVGNEIKVDLLFEHDGITMYRFHDGGRSHYFTSRGETITSQTTDDHSYEENITQPVDTLEKHFDCRAESCECDEHGQYWITTECGILFESSKSYKPGQVIKGFKSPKHK